MKPRQMLVGGKLGPRRAAPPTRAEQVEELRKLISTDPSTHHLDALAIANRLYARGARVRLGR